MPSYVTSSFSSMRQNCAICEPPIHNAMAIPSRSCPFSSPDPPFWGIGDLSLTQKAHTPFSSLRSSSNSRTYTLLTTRSPYFPPCGRNVWGHLAHSFSPRALFGRHHVLRCVPPPPSSFTKNTCGSLMTVPTQPSFSPQRPVQRALRSHTYKPFSPKHDHMRFPPISAVEFDGRSLRLAGRESGNFVGPRRRFHLSPKYIRSPST